MTDSKFIFVVGSSRSGTTMMGRILGGHQSVFTFHEIHFFEELATHDELDKPLDESSAPELLANLFSIQRDGYLKKRNPDKFYDLSKQLVQKWQQEHNLSPVRVFAEYLLHESRNNGKNIPCDQTPRNLFYLDEILENYPGAKVINMIRDPRDVLLSQKKKWKRRFLGAKNIPLREALRSWANYHPYIISRLWNSSISTAEQYEDDQRVMNVYFEDLLHKPRETIQEICSFLDLEYTLAMLQIPQIGSSSTKDRPEARGIDASRASSWQQGGLTKTELRICQQVCGSNMEKHGYGLHPLKTNRLNVAGSLFLLPFKASLSLAMNISRYRNIMDSMKRRFA